MFRVSSFFFKSPLHFYGEIGSMVFGFDSDTAFLRHSSAQFTWIIFLWNPLSLSCYLSSQTFTISPYLPSVDQLLWPAVGNWWKYPYSFLKITWETFSSPFSLILTVKICLKQLTRIQLCYCSTSTPKICSKPFTRIPLLNTIDRHQFLSKYASQQASVGLCIQF